MVSLVKNGNYYMMIVYTVLVFVTLSFGVLSVVSKSVSSKRLNGCVFSNSVATVGDYFQNSNMSFGRLVGVSDTKLALLRVGDYIVFNDFVGSVVRVDNCGKLVKIELEGLNDYLYVKSEINGETLRLPANLYLGKVEYYSQIQCGWLRFIASSWSSIFFILIPFLLGWWVCRLW